MIRIFNTNGRGKGIILRIGKFLYLDILVSPSISLFLVVRSCGKYEYPSFTERKERLYNKYFKK